MLIFAPKTRYSQYYYHANYQNILTMTYTKRLYILTLFLAMICPTLLHAQFGTFFSSSQKLSSSYVNHVYQDRIGFIWVATEDGLNRYDGYTFQRFGEQDGLSVNNVICSLEDKNSYLYVGTSNGLFVKIKGQFHKLKNADTGEDISFFINSLCEAPDGSIILSTSGRGVWRVTDVDKMENIIPAEGYAQFVTQLAFDRKGILWTVSEKKGVASFKMKKPNDYKSFKMKKAYSINDNFSYASICLDSNDRIYVGASNGGVYVLDSKTDNFSLCPSSSQFRVFSMTMRRDDVLFVGTNGNGLYVYNPVTGYSRPSIISSRDVNLSKSKVASIFVDKTNNLWLGLFQKGVFMQPPHSDTFHCLGIQQQPVNVIGESCVLSVHSHSNGTLWISSDQDGLYALDSNHNRISHFSPISEGGTVPSAIVDIEENIDGRLWIGTYTEGCGWVDTNTGTYHRAPFSYGNSQSVFDIRHDKEGNLWLGTLGDGLKKYNPFTDEMEVFKAATDTNSLCNDFIQQMAFSTDGSYLYVGTSAGLSCYDIKKKSWLTALGMQCILRQVAIHAILDDGKGNLWLGTAQGLHCHNIKSRKTTTYTTADGLPDNHICAIEMDKAGGLWVSTSNGLARFYPEKRKAECFYVSDGLQGNEYSTGASFYDMSSNKMYFAGTSGVSYFDPSKAKQGHEKLSVIISSIGMSGERITSFSKSGRFDICNEAVSLASRFDFCHEDNSISLHFSTLTYSGTERMYYQYSINGESWITLPAGENTISLFRLAPGDYKFRVKAVDNGVESEIKEFTIVIHNPWYFTPFARIIYLLLAIAVVLWYLRLVRVRNEARLRLQEHMHKEELNEQKLRFFINISHEIRTPMSLIISPLLQLIRDDHDSQRQSIYEIMKRNAERILHLVNQILDLRKIDEGQMRLHMQETDMTAFVGDVLKLFRPQATSKNITLRFEHPDDALPVWIDRSNFDTVVINLMSNAMKYTPTGGLIRVTLNNMPDLNCCQLHVFDNGEQIPEDSLKRIFERFHQVATSINQSKVGTGIGLDLAKSLVHLHHGNIEVANVKDGVEFIVTLPLGKEHLHEEEIAHFDEAEIQKKEEEKLMEAVPAADINEEEVLKMVKSGTSKRPTIVVVEDDDDIRDYLKSQLSSTYRVLSYPDGTEALPAILRELPQVVVSDIMMPNMDGNTLTAKVKANVSTNHIPIILLTAKTRDEDKLEGLETGADLYVTKPFNMDILRRHIANLIASRRLMQNKFTGKEDMKTDLDNVTLETADDKLLARIMSVVNANLGNSDLNIDMICSEVGISRVHLHRKMKELTNQTPHDFIRNLRLKQAARLLSHKGQSITEVMYRCGFNSATSFSTMFKKMYGVSPREYMKSQE